MTPDIQFLGDTTTPIEALGIGVFDGIHKGHQSLLAHCDALLSFFPRPGMVLRPNLTPQILSTPDEMAVLHPRPILLTFTEEIARFSPETFLDVVMTQHLNPKKIVVGEDFRFGHQQSGSIHTLRAWGDANQVEVHVVSPVVDEAGWIKSGRVRECLLAGEMDVATTLLGHPYLMIGEVHHGDGRGASLGFPTANLKVPEYKLIPKEGVYMGTVALDKPTFAMIYIGTKPTFDGKALSIEVHIPQFSDSLYGTQLHVSLYHKVRDEMKFRSQSDLVRQIEADLEAAKRLFEQLDLSS